MTERTHKTLLRSLTVCTLLLTGVQGQAELQLTDRTLVLDYLGALNNGTGDRDQSRLMVQPSLELRASRRLRLYAGARLEAADDRYGLGTETTYSPLSRPFRPNDHLSLELDRLELAYRGRTLRWRAGKLTLPWGALDGLRVLDQVDAARQRDFLFLDQRPDRLSRWGSALTLRRENWQVEIAALLDPTVNQLATAASPLAPTALRSDDTPQETLFPVTERDRFGRDATFALRLEGALGPATLNAVALSAPVLDPILRQHSAADSAPILDYPHRRLFGLGAEIATGALVWRWETTYSPDTPKTASADLGLERNRVWASGIGVDWNAPGAWFVNLQLAQERRSDDPRAAGGGRQTVSTFLARRSFANDRWQLRMESINLLSEGDGLLRVGLRYQVNDRWQLGFGVDEVYGSRDQPFGQFRDASRTWLRLRCTL